MKKYARIDKDVENKDHVAELFLGSYPHIHPDLKIVEIPEGVEVLTGQYYNATTNTFEGFPPPTEPSPPPPVVEGFNNPEIVEQTQSPG